MNDSTFQAGDFVKITDCTCGHYFPIGAIVRINYAELDPLDGMWQIDAVGPDIDDNKLREYSFDQDDCVFIDLDDLNVIVIEPEP